MIDVVALGELLIDFSCLSTDSDGYPTMAAHPGGAPSNFLATLAKFGARTALLGKVGTDTFGRLLTGTLSLTGEPARSATYRAVEYARGKGKLITYDPNLRMEP